MKAILLFIVGTMFGCSLTETETQPCNSSTDCSRGWFCIKRPNSVQGTQGSCMVIGASWVIPGVQSATCAHPNWQLKYMYDQRGQRQIKGRWYECYTVVPMGRYICPDCGATGSDRATGPSRLEGPECDQFLKDQAAAACE